MALLYAHEKRAVGQKSRAVNPGKLAPVEYEAAHEVVDKELLVA